MDIRDWGFSVNDNNHLVIGGCDVVSLAAEFGTPIHVIDKSRLLQNYSRFRRAFENPYVGVEVYYSYKTNCLPRLLQVLHNTGAGAEVISHYELWLALKLGVQPGNIIFNGPNKSLEALRLAVQNDIKLINIDSMNEIPLIEAVASDLGKKASVGVRLMPPVGWQAQFGLDLESGEAFHAYERLARSKHIRVRGMHVHVGTGIKKPPTYTRALEHMLSFARHLKDKLGVSIDFVDIGGGFGTPTVRTFSKIGGNLYSLFNNLPEMLLRDVPPIEAFAAEILSSVQRLCRRFGLNTPVVCLEPGRNITSSPQVLLLKIGVLKDRGKSGKIAITDGGRMTIANPVSYEYHEAFIANRVSSKRAYKVRITGNLCTPADILYRNKRMPELLEGDLLVIMDAGAYFMSLSNNFAFPRPPVVLASEGIPALIRRRESFENLIALDDLS